MWSVIGYVPSFTTIILSPNSPNIEFYSDPVWLKRVNLPSLVAPILIVIRTYKIYTAVGINESGNFNVHYYDFFTGCFCNVVDFLWCTTRGRFPRDMSETLCLLEFRWTSQRFMCREAIKTPPDLFDPAADAGCFFLCISSCLALFCLSFFMHSYCKNLRLSTSLS